MSPTTSLTSEAFVTRWKGRDLSERASAQSHFNDLCDMLGEPKPTDQRETESEYGFEVRLCIRRPCSCNAAIAQS